MGAEKPVKMRVAGKVSAGTALLETDYLLFRGEPRTRIAFADIERVDASGGVLTLTLAKRTIAFEIGAAAASWAEKIARPKSIVQKLGVTTGASVAIIGTFDDDFVADVERAGARITRGARGKDHDHILFAATNVGDLAKVSTFVDRLGDRGGIWVVYPKGRKDLREADVLGAGRAAGLKDVKVARFSDTLTALRFVLPLASRGT